MNPPPVPEPSLPTLADALCARLNTRGMGRWLLELAHALDLPVSQLMVEPPLRQHVVVAEHLGLALMLSHPHAGHVARGDADRWLITEARFGMAGQYGLPWRDALPFGLDAEHETPSSAGIKLGGLGETTGLSSAACTRGDLRQTWFFDDALALELTWQAGGVGISHLWALRLGGELLLPGQAWMPSSRLPADEWREGG